MRIVLDTSAAVEIALGGVFARSFGEAIAKADLVIAPDTFVSEVTNVFWKYRKFSDFTDQKCLTGIQFCIDLIDLIISTRELWRESYFEGTKHGHSTSDLFYLVCARRNSASLMTRDKKLNEIAQSEGIEVL